MLKSEEGPPHGDNVRYAFVIDRKISLPKFLTFPSEVRQSENNQIRSKVGTGL